MNTAIAWNKSRFTLWDRSDFDIINNLSVVFHDFARRLLTSFSVDMILLLRYENWSTNFRDLQLTVNVAPFCLKHIYAVLFLFMHVTMPPQQALGYEEGIIFEQVYIQIGLYHLHRLNLS